MTLREPSRRGPPGATAAELAAVRLPRPGRAGAAGLHGGADGQFHPAELPVVERHVGSGLGRLQELPPDARRPHLPARARQHRLFHRRDRAPAVDPAAPRRGAPQLRHPRRRHLPHRLLHAGDHLAGDQRPALGDDLRAELRHPELLPARHRPRQLDPALARRPPHRDAEHHRGLGLAVARLLSRHLLRRDAEHPDRALRRGEDGQRQPDPPLLARHRADRCARSSSWSSSSTPSTASRSSTRSG